VGLAAAAATLLGTFMTGAARPIPMRSTTLLLILWVLYTTLTTFTAVSGAAAWWEWNRFARIIFMCFVAMMLLQDKKRLLSFLFVCMASVGFYGVKGGAFSLATGGNYRVWGPPGSFIEGNNELALAELMILPLMLYFSRQVKKGWQRLCAYGAVVLTIMSILFSYSRGAFLAFGGLTLLLILRSRYRIQALVAVIALVIPLMTLAPQQWKARMFSEGGYEDASAMGRINAWHFAYNLAKDRLFGGGFRSFTRELFGVYAPNPADVHDAHSIYFEVMAEQGFPGLAIFLSILATTLWRLERLRASRRYRGELRWVSELAAMLQYSVIAYMLGGTFLGLAYFDLPYYMVMAAILLEYIAHREAAAVRTREATSAPATAAAAPELVGGQTAPA
jgi:putative inorganic carbon (HCO3(-)) transporter